MADASPLAHRGYDPGMADTTQSSITIDAEPGAVLDVIADLEAYPDWAGEITKVEILAEEGDGWPDRVQMTMDAGVIKDTYTLDYDWDIAEDGSGTISWTLVEASVLKAMDGTYTLTASDAGTDVEYSLLVDLKIPVLGMLKRKAERVIIDTALKELKKRVESL
jgi:ribosome-associated toxin RatA of RatAB toxin-antitoxin module